MMQVPDSYLQSIMSPYRYAHSKRVAETAVKLGAQFGIEDNRLYVMGMWHDIAKELTPAEFDEMGIPLSDSLRQLYDDFPFVWHSFSGPVLLREKWGVVDPEIHSAIESHTTGKAMMSNLDMCLYVSDYIEPGRPFHDRGIIQRLAYDRLEYAVWAISTQIMAYLTQQSKRIHPDTMACVEWFSTLLTESEKQTLQTTITSANH